MHHPSTPHTDLEQASAPVVPEVSEPSAENSTPDVTPAPDILGSENAVPKICGQHTDDTTLDACQLASCNFLDDTANSSVVDQNEAELGEIEREVVEQDATASSEIAYHETTPDDRTRAPEAEMKETGSNDISEIEEESAASSESNEFVASSKPFISDEAMESDDALTRNDALMNDAPPVDAAPRRRGRPRRSQAAPASDAGMDTSSTQDTEFGAGGNETLDVEGWDDDPDAGQQNTESTSEALPRRAKPTSAHGEFDVVFREWTRTRDPRLRERLILMNRNLVSYIARRFMDRGEMSEDIVQQGLIGLINALDHFDPSRGVRFATFATPTIMGEIRRYFRDKSWGIRVPRRLQELNQVINGRIEDLTQELNRSPTYAEIARALNLPIEEVVEALEMGSVMEPISIDEEISFGRDEPGTSIGDQIGECDPQLEGWGDYAALETALQKLPEKERRVLQLAYFHDHSQVEIARHMKVSQMFVSRLQRRALAHLRELMNSQDV